MFFARPVTGFACDAEFRRRSIYDLLANRFRPERGIELGFRRCRMACPTYCVPVTVKCCYLLIVRVE